MSRLDILYVDDDADIRTIVQMSLSIDADITVRIAASGQEGLDLLVAGPRPDVIVLDVMMPGMDGPEVLGHIRADPWLADVPVIFMTAKGRLADVESYYARGAQGIILKPFDPISLAGDIRAILHGLASESVADIRHR